MESRISGARIGTTCFRMGAEIRENPYPGYPKRYGYRLRLVDLRLALPPNDPIVRAELDNPLLDLALYCDLLSFFVMQNNMNNHPYIVIP